MKTLASVLLICVFSTAASASDFTVKPWRTDRVFLAGGLFFRHQTVNHMAGVFAEGAATTNGIESVWAVLKRGVYGVYHQISKKHLAKYVNEFTFRLNEGNVKRHSLERLDSMVTAIVGKRLTYAGLTA